MTSFDSKVLLGSQKMRTHVTMVFAWSEPIDIFLYCAITIAHKNLILEIGYTYYANSAFFQNVHFTNLFSEVNILKAYCVYVFSGKLKLPRASSIRYHLPERQVVKKVNFDPCLKVLKNTAILCF